MSINIISFITREKNSIWNTPAHLQRHQYLLIWSISRNTKIILKILEICHYINSDLIESLKFLFSPFLPYCGDKNIFQEYIDNNYSYYSIINKILVSKTK